MGTWGHGSLDNDHARDWLTRVQAAPSVSALLEALTPNHTEASEAKALAAAEVVAAALGRPCSKLSEGAVRWAAELKADDRLATAALGTVERIRAKSIVRELWEEAGELDEWLHAVDDLRDRIGPTTRPS